MPRRFAIIASAVLLAVVIGSATLVAQAAKPSRGHNAHRGPGASQFTGYWMGIDPLDGGDSRRGITQNADRTFSMIGRDTVFTLCDGTDRAIVRGSDFTRVGSELVSDDVVITCTNNASTVHLKFRYEIIDRNTVREIITSQTDQPVDQIIFHRISRP